MSDFVRDLIRTLSTTPRTAWESRIRANFGGERLYIAKNSPELREKTRTLVEIGIPERTARYKSRGR